MSSPITSSMWMDESDLTLGEFEPSLMTTAICPMSVFDKFGWDNDILGPDADELLDKIIKIEPEDLLDDKSDTDFGSLSSIFPDLIDESKNSLEIDCLKSLLSPHDDSLNLLDEEKFDLKDELIADTFTPVSLPMPVSVNEIKTEVEKDVTNSIIRIPVKRSPGTVNPNFSKPGTGRTVKAVVVCPDRSKSIVCNVVRSSNKSIVIQKPVGRSLLNICSSNQRNEPKLPIKVNVITPKEAFAKFKPTTTKIEPEIKVDIPIEVKVKTEYEEVRPETPQSLIGSDEEYHPFSSPTKGSVKNFDLQDNFKSYLMEEDNLCSESYKCLPPAEVTGQVQPSIPDVFKYTPSSSPSSNEMQGDVLDTFYSKLTGVQSNSTGPSQFYNKAAANVDHDYGFTCRTPKTNSPFCTDSLGIQTPSASEPPTDSDDDDVNLLSDSNLLNDYECNENELDRQSKEYFEKLRRELTIAELMNKNREKESKAKATVGSGVKERKSAARNRKRKSTSNKDKHHSSDIHCDTKIKISLTSSKNEIMKFSTANTTTGLLKVRLPAKDSFNSSKRRKTSSGGGRVFSPSERHLHNTNEQVRRIEMRQSFEELRRLIPKLYDKPRAPKVSILQEAKAYCDELFHGDCKLQAQLTALKCHQERLRTRLSQLRRCAAASRY